ncbi:N-acetyl-gamma-glutamyl-phosphate reductase [Corynebacterium incognita]|uniref:N-acetyl-gamma-glutamyl-phosphate reductase n=1 Tax=Corynebacterium incognita TaxID=2754725 RepID=A0A7G7CPI2_9CORY|nr:N-acetyl-gamma-glutamyl-phosphate reductase [Corynebacterium incognita]QNE89498.1 N-acetyl-gamma-glutamyl-phosphate reductase [Corynebacterium incognita]
MTISLAVAGATGYAGGEIIRLLLGHPAMQSGQLRLRTLFAGDKAEESVAAHLPHLAAALHEAAGPESFAKTTPEALAEHDVVFLALPHGHSAALAQQLPESVKLIDCAADFRLESGTEWGAYYNPAGTNAATPWAGTWPYGLPELPGKRASIQSANRVAVPGCFPTAVSLAAYPALAAGLALPDVSVTAVTGASGAGKKPSAPLLGAELMGNLKPYSAAGAHRHIPEILQNLAPAVGKEASDVALSFTPVLAPLTRGILAVAIMPLAAEIDVDAAAKQLRGAYHDAYATEPFIELLDAQAGQFPETANVAGSNRVQIAVDVDKRARKVIATAAVDNLTKGTGGAAVQCMNLMVGFPETAGLPLTGLRP